MQLAQWQSLLGLVMGFVSFSGGIMLWYKGAIEKRYASERDFGHLRRSQEQMYQSVLSLAKDLDERTDRLNDELLQIKVLMTAMMAKDGKMGVDLLRDR